MRFIGITLGFFIWPFALVGILALLVVTVYSFVFGDFNVANYTYFIDLFNPCIHAWVRALYVTWLAISITFGVAAKQLG